MLIEFRVENHRSLRDEQALTLEAGGKRLGESSSSLSRSVTGYDTRLLPATAIYGANASGKSNVLDALTFMRLAVLLSHRRWEPEGGIPRTAFAWGSTRNEPSMFEVSFLIEGTKYRYGFTVNDEVVEEEWLFAWPNGRKQAWFEREGERFKFGEHLKGPNEAVKEVTRPNALFLSAAAQHGHSLLKSLFAWFHRIYPISISRIATPLLNPGAVSEIFFPPDNDQLSLFSKGKEDDTLVKRIRQLLTETDIGIVDIKTIEREQEFEGHAYQRTRILLQHQLGNEDSWLDYREESAGTKTLFRLALPIFRTLDMGGLLLVDELESSLHPSLGAAIVKLFNRPKTNPKNAQIVFTTHDTNLLGTMVGEPLLRRDQIWFTEKNEEGATQLYPLTDYKPRKSENLERGYLQGRYGAIPFLGNVARITE